MRIVVLGLSITSSWGNGHATTYRALLKGLHQRGHQTLFLERDKPWYRDNRDLAAVPYAQIELYENLPDLDKRFGATIRSAGLVIVGSYVPEGALVAEWVTQTARGIAAFYDIDTPVTLSKLEQGDEEYLAADTISKFALYFSFTGGPTLRRLARDYGAKMPRALYCSVDPDLYFPEPQPARFLMGYLGTYSADRQPALERLLMAPARRMANARFAVAGPLYPSDIEWPKNVLRTEHLPPNEHRAFYNSQQFTLNVTRADMLRLGYSPSVRLFEAAACGTPILSDPWPGLDDFFMPGREIAVASSKEDALRVLTHISERERLELGRRARRRVLASHTAIHRAIEIERAVAECEATLSVPASRMAARSAGWERR